jgi:DNA-directed RNA polymerase subunit RPC12/RpoP
MSTRVTSSGAPATIACPNCQSEMIIAQVVPVLFSDDQDAVTYRCKECRSEIKRTFKKPNPPYFNE